MADESQGWITYKPEDINNGEFYEGDDYWWALKAGLWFTFDNHGEAVNCWDPRTKKEVHVWTGEILGDQAEAFKLPDPLPNPMAQSLGQNQDESYKLWKSIVNERGMTSDIRSDINRKYARQKELRKEIRRKKAGATFGYQRRYITWHSLIFSGFTKGNMSGAQDQPNYPVNGPDEE